MERKSYCNDKGLFCTKQIENCLIDKDGQCNEEARLLKTEVENSYEDVYTDDVYSTGAGANLRKKILEGSHP